VTKIGFILLVTSALVIVMAFTWRGRNQHPRQVNEPGEGYNWIVKSSIGPALVKSSLPDELASFSRPRVAADAMPPAVSELMRRVELHPAGSLQPEQSRLLLKELGMDRARLYAAPTSHGWVCYATTNGIASCVSSLAGDASWKIESRKGPPAVVFHGLVANNVTGIELILKSGSKEASLANNAFYGEADDIDVNDVFGFRLCYLDGGSKVIEFDQ
jgi:hypothetical protein